ncbi:hypothetical protein GCM10022261_02840 [Brevibacterium daeguense]|uniref:CHAT domain-containing protein n=1 Tax=Brevibacterium daeguense TaxID=909936 RepID=A0ABP8EFK7_9MICO|nr:DUF6642 family protein [Brevibacterium daeguense]
MAVPGIWVTEGYWSSDVSDSLSVRPMMQVLAASKTADHVHRHINDPDDLVKALTLLGQRRQDRFSIAYIACHGSPGVISFGDDQISLEELADALPSGALESKTLHFGACSVLQDEAACRTLLEATGAKAITGFTQEVDWLESMALDLLMFNLFFQYERIGFFERAMKRNYGELVDKTGFTVFR